MTLGFVGIILKDLRLHPYGPQKVTQVFSKMIRQPELNLVFSPKVVESLFPSSFVQKKKKNINLGSNYFDRSQEVLELLSSRCGVVL